MIEQLKTIRAGLETATCYSMLGVDAHSVQIALTALAQIEAMVGEPVAWLCIVNTADAGPTKFFTAPSDPRGFPVFAAPVAQQYEAGDMASAHNDGFRAGVASVAQQPQAEAVPPDVVRDAERWRMLPAYFYEYQIDAMKLYRDIDAAIAQQKGGV